MEGSVTRGASPDGEPRKTPRRTGRGKRAATISKDVIRTSLEAANAMFASALPRYGHLALNSQEIDVETNALYDLIRGSEVVSRVLAIPLANISILQFLAVQWIIFAPRVSAIQLERSGLVPQMPPSPDGDGPAAEPRTAEDIAAIAKEMQGARGRG